MPMNPEIKAQWIADLRSGNFTQGKAYLDKDNKMCCLGVLCNQAWQVGKVLKSRSKEPGADVTLYDDRHGLLPTSVLQWAGIVDRDSNMSLATEPMIADGHVFVKVDGELVTLVNLNDAGDWNFAMIADALEADEEI